MKEILIPLNFTTTPAVTDTKQSFSTSDEASGVLTFTTTADVVGTVASLTIRNASENANRQTVLIERLDVNSSPFSYALKNPLPFGQYEGTVLLKKNLTVIASATFLFGVNSSLSAEVLPDLVKAYSLDELVENVETEVSNLKDAFTLTVSETVKGVNKTESTLQAQENVRYLNEHTRKTNEESRIANEQARIAAELLRKDTFDTLVDSAVIEETVAQEVANEFQQIESTYTNRLLSTEQQLEQAATKAELSAIATPKAVSLVAQMTDVAKIYVYTGAEGGYTAGNWYYHNGTAWTSGGVYQSTGLSDGTVKFKTLFKGIKKIAQLTNLVLDSAFNTGVTYGSSDGAGKITNSVTGATSVRGGYKLYMLASKSYLVIATVKNTSAIALGCSRVLYKADATILNNTQISTGISSGASFTDIFTYVPSADTSVLWDYVLQGASGNHSIEVTYNIFEITDNINVSTSDIAAAIVYGADVLKAYKASYSDISGKANTVEPLSINANSFSDALQTSVVNNKIDGSTAYNYNLTATQDVTIPTKTNLVNNTAGNAYFGYTFTPKANHKYLFVSIIKNNTANLIQNLYKSFIKNNATFLSLALTNQTLAANSEKMLLQTLTVDGTFTKIGSAIGLTALNQNIDLTQYVVDITGISDTYIDLLCDKLIEPFNVFNHLNTVAIKSVYADRVKTGWENKVLDTLGDSITAQGKWKPYLQNHFNFSNILNHGIGGTSVGGTGANAFWQDARINALSAVSDGLTVLGGTNDWGESRALGELSLTNVDTANFTGAYNVMLTKILTLYPTLKILLVGCPYGEMLNFASLGWTDKTHNTLGLKSSDYADRVGEIAKMWGIPFVNLQDAGINALNIGSYFIESDHIHVVIGEPYAKVIKVGLSRLAPMTK